MDLRERSVPTRPDGAEPEWSSLLGRIFDDFTRLLQGEVRLLELNLGRMLTAVVDRALGQLLLLSAVVVGGLCLVGSLITGLAIFMPWWAAFAVSGVLVMGGGLLADMGMKHYAARVGRSTASD
jgi:hypothetical protein